MDLFELAEKIEEEKNEEGSEDETQAIFLMRNKRAGGRREDGRRESGRS